MVKATHGTNGNEDQAYMNIAIGIRIAAKHAKYKRASGPLDEKYRLEYREKY